jgi:phenylacetate-CoA ligase
MRFDPTLAFKPLQQQNEYQLDGLKKLLAYLQSHAPFYQKLFKQNNINVERIQSLADLQSLPTTAKSDMQERNMEFLCVPVSEVKEYTATSGTKGKPVTIALTENDLHRLAYNERQSFVCADGKPEDIYQLMLTLDRQFMAGMAYYSGIRQLGAALVRTGPGLPDMQWETINRVGSNSLVTVPSFLLKLTEWAMARHIDLRATPVKKAICIGESIRNEYFELNALGQKIDGGWPVKLYSTYASTEMQTAFTECAAGQGGHHQADLVIMEIIDEDGKQLPAGAYGELAITTIGIEGMPLLRYRTGDICAYFDEPCSCGRHSLRLSPVMGRKQQMIKYKGTTFYPPALFEILNNISFVKEYAVEVFTGDLGLDEIRLHINTHLSVDECEVKIRPALQSGLRVIPLLQFHSANSINQLQFPEGSRKQVKFIDNRKQ